MAEALLKDAEERMRKAVEQVEHELRGLRTGRASTAALEGIRVPAYGGESPLNQIATVTTPDATTLAIQPWDPHLVGAIEKALLAANLGMTPQNDGKVVRLHVPALTEETRREIVRKAHLIAEQGRVAVRNVRRHVNDEIKRRERDHSIGEDDKKRLLDQVQKKTDQQVTRIDELLQRKEREILQV